MKKFACFLLLIPGLCLNGYSQNTTGINNPTPNSAAALDVKADGIQGFIPPRLPGNFDGSFGFAGGIGAGLFYYDSLAQHYRFYAGTGGWKTFGDNSSVPSWGLLGNAGTNPATDFLGTTDAQPLMFRVNNQPLWSLSLLGMWNGSSVNDNVAIGRDAGRLDPPGGFNTFIGNFAGFDLSNGERSTHIGYDAGRYTTDGLDNTFVGAYSGQSNFDGNSNTLIGAGADVTKSNLYNATAIGYAAMVSVSEALVLGRDVHVGIGTSSPAARLHVRGPGLPGILIQNNEPLYSQGTEMSALHFGDEQTVNPQASIVAEREKDSSGDMDLPTAIVFKTTSSGDFIPKEQMRISNIGNVGIGTNTPGTRLHVNGQFRYEFGTIASGRVLTSDAAGNASWQVPSGVNGTGSVGVVPYWIGVGTLGNSAIFSNGSNVAIGTPLNVNYIFQVSQTTVFPAIYGQNSGNGGTGVWGYSNNVTDGTGVRGVSTGAGRGVWGSNSGATGYGGYFENTSTGYAAVFMGGNVGIRTNTPAVSLDVVGGFATREGVTASPGADIDGYNPGNNSFITFNGTVNFNLRGIVPGADGQHLIIYNRAALSFTVQNEASGIAAQSIRTGAGSVVVPPNASIHLIYTTGTNRWLMVAGPIVDNLGNHTATQNIRLNSNYISGDGDSEGLFVDNAGRVGIGTNAPTSMLEVNGNTEIPATAEYTYSSGKTKYYSIPAAEFQPRTSASTVTIHTATTEQHYASGTGSMMAPLHLPDGAQINNVTIFLYDASVTIDFTNANLYVYNFTTATFTNYPMGGAATGTPGNTSMSVTPGVITVDNQNNSYFIQVQVNEASNNLRVRGARITYTVTKAD